MYFLTTFDSNFIFQVKYSQLIGDVRGRGLVHGLEIVTDNVSRKPNSPMAINIMYGLKAEKILVGICGKNRNVVFISPPMCFTMDNCRYVYFEPKSGEKCCMKFLALFIKRNQSDILNFKKLFF